MFYRFQRLYIALMMAIVGRGLAIASRIDDYTRREAARVPAGTIIAMRVNPSGPGCYLVKTGDALRYVGGRCAKPADVDIIFKHLQHAWRLFTFQENTPIAFARDRLLLDGEVAHAMVFNRCLARLMSLILPRFIARHALKRYPDIGLAEKLRGAAGIYLRLLFERKGSVT